jgi:exopolyphosphatase/pppGpp-phosphohydrolase
MFTIDDNTVTLPFGSATLVGFLTSDPPPPEDLTNAIGHVVDHLDDVDRELPMVVAADRIQLAGEGVATLAAVEVGHAVELPFVLHRDAAEEVFRTLVTEPRAERRRNPGLPPEEVDQVVGVCAAVVAIMRDRSVVSIELVS